MGFMSNLFDKPSSNADGARYSNLQNSSNIPNQSFKQRNSLPERQAAVASIRAKFPNKVPVIVERFKKVSFFYSWYVAILNCTTYRKKVFQS